ncbi:putative LRO1-a lecithin cholesterol acyltransferase-like protein [Venustampulla echinocandica]|uniref:Putative LRO1-a lecithin cholesterol acyltransferase-like protein n=1 Tax=Venustampulla echinocandica TaxID=2656787 RepID=A0A370TG09_9HELO|nr:putative LRO1-a lecithin cholesterol acyltransferase-like protein [Venustampulla echinocandica]RDL33823.1 putative LRO1-a lecithin cholesterol acyltransferase-like protein [Venustampulla echinocandica]
MSSSLRRRIWGNANPSDSPPKAADQQLVRLSKAQSSQSPKYRKRRNGFIFFLGGLFGIMAAGFFANRSDLIDFPEFGDLSMDSLMDILPASFMQDARDMARGERETVNYDSFSVGLNLLAQGIRANHPVIMVPGVISTGLESWGTTNSTRQYFRKRLWGSWSMMRALVLDKEGWKRHIMLDKDTGLDPPDGIKLRAAQGFDAADFFITGYWIWNKILENLATIGYDPTNSFTAAYDWRLSYENLEVRDQYFTRLKIYIEMAYQVSNKKVVVISHSMGSQVLFYFFHWVAAADGGGGGDGWVDKYVDSWINISGCMLGALKGLPAVLSGEMKDTAQLNAFAVYGLEKFLSKDERAEIFRAMPGISSMLPMGGNAVWGNATWAPDDLPGQNVSFGPFLNFKFRNGTTQHANLTVEDSLSYLGNVTEPWYGRMVGRSYSNGVAHTTAEVEANEKDPRKWINPLETRLPLAPNLKIYCFYGIGKPTERSYFYRRSENPFSNLNITIDTSLTQDNIDHGVVLGEGDGTVNLLSVGYMCNKGWKMHRYNPAGVKVNVYEMPHEPERFSPRGGPNTGDHVDILGRQSLNDLILRVAGGRGEDIGENIVSDIGKYAERVEIREEDEYL